MQPVGGGQREAQQQRPPAGWGHAVQFGLPHDFRAIGVGPTMRPASLGIRSAGVCSEMAK
jgi:hypothetical protein